MSNKIIFIGGCWEKRIEQVILENSIGAVQNAANILQNNLIEGLDRYSDDGVTVLSSIYIGSYPSRYRKLRIHRAKFNHIKSHTNHVDYYIPFLNIPVFKHLSRIKNCKKQVKTIINASKEDNIYMIGYSMTFSTVKTLLFAKKMNPNIKTCLIIPDLPEYMNLGIERNKVKELLKNVSNKVLYSDVSKIDSYVMLTKYMAEKINVTGKKMCVVEGIATSEIVIKKVVNEKLKKIVYTGTLDSKYGICELIKAFLQIEDKNARLIICGYGDSEGYINEVIQVDPRIVFKGSVNNITARELQNEAYFLINPRRNDEEYTKYSFPSKTLEYMLSGRPILMYKLKGIPDEYDDYLYYVCDGLKKSIERLLNTNVNELTNIGNLARKFVIDNKNKYTQTERIFNMLQTIGE